MWLLPQLDANGVLELNIDTIWGKGYSVMRPSFSKDQLRQALDQFTHHGLLYRWTENHKRYGYFTRIEKRLPSPSEREHHWRLPLKAFRFVKTQKGNRLDETSVNEFLATVELYIEECAARDATSEIERETAQQSLLPTPLNQPTTEQIQAAAEKRADENLILARDELVEKSWAEFWTAYPNHYNERSAHIEFYKLGAIERTGAMEALLLWLPYLTDPETLPQQAANWLKEGNWKKQPPEMKNGNGRTIGPAARTTEQYRTRMQRNAKILGLDPGS